jgi:hypothetical protein
MYCHLHLPMIVRGLEVIHGSLESREQNYRYPDTYVSAHRVACQELSKSFEFICMYCHLPMLVPLTRIRHTEPYLLSISHNDQIAIVIE